jgi:hypothetical protein
MCPRGDLNTETGEISPDRGNHTGRIQFEVATFKCLANVIGVGTICLSMAVTSFALVVSEGGCSRECDAFASGLPGAGAVRSGRNAESAGMCAESQRARPSGLGKALMCSARRVILSIAGTAAHVLASFGVGCRAADDHLCEEWHLVGRSFVCVASPEPRRAW